MISTGCTQSVRYDKTILVGNGHTSAPLWREVANAGCGGGLRRQPRWRGDEAAVAGPGIARIQKIGGPGTTTIMRILNSYPDGGVARQGRLGR